MRRADPQQAAKSARASPRFEIDRAWLWRGGLVLAVVAFILVLAKASLMLFGSGNQRLERHERANEQRTAMQTVGLQSRWRRSRQSGFAAYPIPHGGAHTRW